MVVWSLHMLPLLVHLIVRVDFVTISGRLGTPTLSSVVGTMRNTSGVNMLIGVALHDSTIISFVISCISPGRTQTMSLLRDLKV
jgi:hypothetical protein